VSGSGKGTDIPRKWLHVGIVFGLEVSRVARNNVEWYRLFDLCSITGTLVGDSDGIYDPRFLMIDSCSD
jgi:hypothetical protein